jgi:Peptidase family M23
LEDNPTYNTPVFAPCHGVVVKVVADVEDRPLGSNNFHHNWGNLAIIGLDGGPYVKLCHLKRDSLVVAEGQRVKPGELIGYCGNSGRSPRPHLHVQLQATPRVGATTVPFRLRHYVEAAGGGRVYHAVGLPGEDARVQPAASNDQLAAQFDNLAERRYRFSTRFEPAGGGESMLDNEEVECSTNELGQYRFHSSSGAELTACIVDRVFYTLDYAGPTDSVLFYFWLGLSRVPFIDDTGVRWTDLLDARPVLTTWAAELASFIGPFANNPLLHTTSHLETVEHGNGAADADFCFVCDVAHSLPTVVTRCCIPKHIRLWISRTHWVVRIQAQSAAGGVTIEQADF